MRQRLRRLGLAALVVGAIAAATQSGAIGVTDRDAEPFPIEDYATIVAHVSDGDGAPLLPHTVDFRPVVDGGETLNFGRVKGDAGAYAQILDPGTYVVHVEADGYMPATSGPIEVAKGEQEDVHITLEAADETE
jgi:hypothetical protein